MATKVFTFLKGLALVAIAFLCVIVGISVWSNHNRVNSLLDNLNNNSIEINKSLVELNKPKIGVIAQVYELIHQSRLTIDVANHVAIDEQHFLEKTQPDEVLKLNAILDQTNSLLLSSNNTIATIGTSTNSVLGNLDKSVIKSGALLDESKTAVSNANKVISNPDIPETIANVKHTTANIQATTSDVTAMVDDTKDYWHKVLHPTIMHRIWTTVTNTGITVAKFFY